MRRRVATTLQLLALIALLVAGCAPAAGRQSGSAIPAGADPIAAVGGETVYVRVDYSLEAFGLVPADLSGSLWVPSGYDSERTNITSQFALRDVQAGGGWEVDLSRVRVERTSGRNASGVEFELWAEVRVGVPEEPIPGVYRVRGILQHRSGERQPVEFRLDVRP